MDFIKKNLSGILVCFIIAVPAWLLGKAFPVIGGPVIAILAGMLITLIWTDKGKAEAGIKDKVAASYKDILSLRNMVYLAQQIGV